MIALTGFMGSGKSTVGRALARRLGWAFIDLDRHIVAEAGRDIPDIFREEGEAGFRSRESAVLQNLLADGREDGGLVLALGGGTLTRSDNAAAIKRNALVVFLDVGAETAWRRVKGSGRPLARTEEEFVELLEMRRPVYLEYADVTIEVENRSTVDIVEALLPFAQSTIKARE